MVIARSLLVLTACVSTSVFAEEEDASVVSWQTDFEVAKQTASAGSKDLFINFTGSDWCGFCISLHDKVLTTRVFENGASKHFVLVELDYPNHKQQSEELKAQNEKLLGEFGVEGFPTLFLSDQDGRVFANIPNQPAITPEQLIGQMNTFRDIRVKRDEFMEQAEKEKGLKRAEKLNEALNVLDPEIVERFYGELVDEVISLDKDDKLKRKKGRAFAKAIRELETEIYTIAKSGNRETIAATIDTFIEGRKLKNEEKQQALMLKMGLYSADQLDDVLALLAEIEKIKPDTDTGKEAAVVRARVALYRDQREAAKSAER